MVYLYTYRFSVRLINKLKKCIMGKTDDTAEISAIAHNTVENVDSLNEDLNHWLACREVDKKFIDSIYHDVISICSIDERCLVADYGCGTGVLVSKLKNDFPKIEIIGYDFSESKIRRCRSFYDVGPECFSRGSVYDPISRKFDVIIATEVLEHLEYPTIAVKNLLSALNTSGRLFLTVPDGRTDTYHGHIHFWSPESWKLYMEELAGSYGDIKVGKLAGKNFALVQRR